MFAGRLGFPALEFHEEQCFGDGLLSHVVMMIMDMGGGEGGGEYPLKPKHP